MLDNLSMLLLPSADFFFKNNFLKKKYIRNTIKVSSFGSRSDRLSVLVQIVFRGFKQMTKVTAGKERELCPRQNTVKSGLCSLRSMHTILKQRFINVVSTSCTCWVAQVLHSMVFKTATTYTQSCLFFF